MSIYTVELGSLMVEAKNEQEAYAKAKIIIKKGWVDIDYITKE